MLHCAYTILKTLATCIIRATRTNRPFICLRSNILPTYPDF